MQQKNDVESEVESLKTFQKQLQKQIVFGVNRRDRIDELTKRKSAKSWTKEKRSKMIRRRSGAEDQRVNAEKMLDEVNYRLAQISE